MLLIIMDEERVVSIFDILYVEVNKHVLIYHLKKENVTASGTLKKVFEEIGDDSFALWLTNVI